MPVFLPTPLWTHWYPFFSSNPSHVSPLEPLLFPLPGMCGLLPHLLMSNPNCAFSVSLPIKYHNSSLLPQHTQSPLKCSTFSFFTYCFSPSNILYNSLIFYVFKYKLLKGRHLCLFCLLIYLKHQVESLCTVISQKSWIYFKQKFYNSVEDFYFPLGNYLF